MPIRARNLLHEPARTTGFGSVAYASIGQQLERLPEAYLGGVVMLDEYRRRRHDLEERQRQFEEQARQLEPQANRHKDLVGFSGVIEDFCQRVRQGLAQGDLRSETGRGGAPD